MNKPKELSSKDCMNFTEIVVTTELLPLHLAKNKVICTTTTTTKITFASIKAITTVTEHKTTIIINPASLHSCLLPQQM